ncbi:MAG: transporter permease [Candidatus Dependentiae bacterium]|nr:transporter permease [Candidatus Dependentiae bacterium]
MMIFVTHVYWLLRRQWYLVNTRLAGMALNNIILWPLVYASTTGYLMPNTFFPDNAVYKGTELLVGIALLQIFVGSFFMLVTLLNEREDSGVLHYHIMATSYRATFVSRMIFYALYIYAFAVPFLPMAKLLLGANLYTDQLHWGALCAVLCMVVVMVTSYVMCLFSLIKTMHDIEYLWSYGVEPLLWLSGFWAPVYAVANSGVPGLSWLTRINPFAYATDALRQLFFHDARFAPLSQCMAVMAIATLIFMLLSYRLLQRRLGTVSE